MRRGAPVDHGLAVGYGAGGHGWALLESPGYEDLEVDDQRGVL
jgi:hypothetical protein